MFSVIASTSAHFVFIQKSLRILASQWTSAAHMCRPIFSGPSIIVFIQTASLLKQKNICSPKIRCLSMCSVQCDGRKIMIIEETFESKNRFVYFPSNIVSQSILVLSFTDYVVQIYPFKVIVVRRC